MPASSNFPISPSCEKQSSIAAKGLDTAAFEVSTCEINPLIEKSLLWKLDLHVFLPLMILFVLASLNRVNIGNAKIQGMTEELKMVGNDFKVALMILFPSYIFFEFPSNLIIRRLPPSLWLTIIMTLWGIITVCQGLVRSHSALVGLWFLLGLFEAGFSPGAVYLISMYYKRYELQWRFSLFFAASILSGASFFIPTIIQEMGYTAIGSQVRTIPIYCVAAMTCLVIAYLTDHLQHRFAFTIAGLAVGIIGYVILLCQSHVPTGAKYMACFFITTGGYMTQPVTWAWVANNMARHYKRSISTALQIGVGNIGGIVASNIFITNQAPKYPVGYRVSL
ncbi:hypothetical protein EAF00_006357 [Botryotinia globosa]|nr:hypothetical protein EAF00_006357 [Botryotinia globosa]